MLDEERALAEAGGWIAANVESAVAELDRMIAVDTSFPPGLGYDDFAGLMEELVAPLGFIAKKSSPNIIGR